MKVSLFILCTVDIMLPEVGTATYKLLFESSHRSLHDLSITRCMACSGRCMRPDTGTSGVLYLFPSRTDVSEFAKGRIDPLIEDNPDTLGRWL